MTNIYIVFHCEYMLCTPPSPPQQKKRRILSFASFLYLIIYFLIKLQKGAHHLDVLLTLYKLNLYYFTFTVNLMLFFPDVTVIVVLPAFLAVTLPLDVTVAMLFLLDLNVNLLAEVIGVTTGLS